MEFTVQRSKWCRAGTNQASRSESRFFKGVANNTPNQSYLLTNAGNMCCLGFVCKQMGVPDNELLGIGLPRDIADGTAALDEMDMINGTLVLDAVLINDNKGINDTERESQLVELFSQRGHKLTFVD